MPRRRRKFFAEETESGAILRTLKITSRTLNDIGQRTGVEKSPAVEICSHVPALCSK